HTLHFIFLWWCSPNSHVPASTFWMASQNHNPASTSITACCPQRSQGTGHSMGKRLQQELMTLMMSGNTGIPIFPESDNHFKWTGDLCYCLVTSWAKKQINRAR
uniref:Uncharacterized protein n=1 Tax=Panthera leo TaxID=9689 RepID=A0A8C8Y2U0_PANLE